MKLRSGKRYGDQLQRCCTVKCYRLALEADSLEDDPINQMPKGGHVPVNDREHTNYANGRSDTWDLNFGETYIGGGNLADAGYHRTIPDSSSPVANPKWRSKVARHISATTSYSRSVGRLTVFRGNLRTVVITTTPPRKTELSGWGQLVYLTDNPLPVAVSSTQARNQAYLDWCRKANQELRTLRSGVSLGELRETLHAIRHPAESLKKGIQDWIAATPKIASRVLRTSKWGNGYARRNRVSDRRRAKAVAQALSGSYLEYANGWAPLVNDIDNAARTAAEFLARDGMGYRKISSKASNHWQKSSKTSGSYVDPALNWTGTRYYQYESDCRIVGEIIVKHSGSFADLSAAASFDLGDFVPTVWELIPLSYVADWFVNVGAILESYAFMSSNRAWWSWTDRNRVLVTLKAVPGGGVFGNPGGLRWQHVSMTRSNPNSYTPSLEFSLPGSHLFRKLANVSSLGVQAVTSSRLINRLIHG